MEYFWLFFSNRKRSAVLWLGLLDCKNFEEAYDSYLLFVLSNPRSLTRNNKRTFALARLQFVQAF